jgi:hypothetical protein
MITLSSVHIQRIRLAVEAARCGARVTFRVNPGEPATVVWSREDRRRTQHVICNGWGDLKQTLAQVEAEFRFQLNQQ